jgi:N-carbamoyl-L-amino-acid hydrolase
MSNTLSIDGARLWNSLMELGEIGGTEKGGSRRLALTELDHQGRELVCGWMRDAGLTISFDRMGNIFGRRPGRDNSLAPVMTGSHIDTQPSGGKFDGCYGVLAGLEVMRVLKDHAIVTTAPLELAIWTNEEGVRFVPTMMGSGVFSKSIPLDHALAATDANGLTVGDEVKARGFFGDEEPGQHPVGSYYEVHIEQGPVLEANENTIGVVTGVLGQRLMNITVTGQEAHAGPTPMAIRKDALQHSLPLMTEILALGRSHGDSGRATIGQVAVLPGARNTIPGLVKFSVDLRNLDRTVLEEMANKAKMAAAAAQERTGLTFEVDDLQTITPTVFHYANVEMVDAACKSRGYSHQRIVSGAGHDACFISRIAPTSMIFVPCKDGISHNEIEDAAPTDLEAGANVLLDVLLRASA